MTKCAVSGCKESGRYKFPKEKKLKALWAKLIRRSHLKNTTTMRLCGSHFKTEDFKHTKSTTGFECQRKILKKGVVPSIFPWTKDPPPYAAAREERLKERNIRKELFPTLQTLPGTSSSVEPTTEETLSSEIPGTSSSVEPTTEETLLLPERSSRQEDALLPNPILNNKSTQTPVLLRLFATEELVYDNDAVKFYTGLETYKKFRFVFSTLCPMAYDLTYKSGGVISVSVEDQFLLTLIKLRRDKCDFELSKMFGVSKSVVSNVFITWLNFMYDIWLLIDMWPSQDLVQYYMPEDFENFKNTRLIIDTTEIPICKPGNPLSQQATFSTYKNKNTIKFLIGATPGGLISYCSDGYGGATSDRQIIERSTLKDLCEPGDVIMADRGFNVQDIFAPKDVTITIPSFLRGMSQLPGIKLKKDRELSRNRVHIERIIGLSKTYTILKSEINSYYVPIFTKIFFICSMLCNFREGIMHKQK